MILLNCAKILKTTIKKVMKKILFLFFSLVNLYAIDIFTASKNGDYYSLVLSARKNCYFELNPKVTRGSLDNIKRLINSKKSSYAIIQADVWEFFKKISDKKTLKKIKFIKKFEH